MTSLDQGESTAGNNDEDDLGPPPPPPQDFYGIITGATDSATKPNVDQISEPSGGTGASSVRQLDWQIYDIDFIIVP